jgi:ribulose kinase
MSHGPSDAHVIGIGVGTPSGRAVVVRVSDEQLAPDRAPQMPAVDRIAATRPVPVGERIS